MDSKLYLVVNLETECCILMYLNDNNYTILKEFLFPNVVIIPYSGTPELGSEV